ncbi:MAG: TonB-dependent receptor [Deltaproteobacteria bacterium]|nr:TonB-dependent receptor [Deltaproteobacteria bacterium]
MKGSLNQKLLMCLLMLAVSLPIGPVWAQEEEEENYREYNLGEVVIRGEKSAVREISITTEITPADFESTNSDTVSEALTFVPGVQVTMGRKYLPYISIHGFDQKRILTLIDGIPYYETKYGSLDLNQIAVDGVARIDVVKGAASVLYGANAEAGVINIITKKPTETPYFSANLEAGLEGVDGGFKARLSHGMKKNMFSYWLSYSHREWDSWEVSDDFVPREGVIQIGKNKISTLIEDGGDRLNSDYGTDTFWAKFGLEPSEDTEIYANFHLISTEKGDPPNIDRVRVFPGDFSQFDRIESYDDWGIDLSGRHQFTDQVGLQARLYYHDHTDTYASYDDETYTNQFALSEYDDYILGGMVMADFKPMDWDTVKAAIHYRGDSHKQRDFEDLPFAESFAYTGSIGVENESLLLNDRLAIVAGVSYDWLDMDEAEVDQENTGMITKLSVPDKKDDLNPMLGVSYKFNDAGKVFASIARKTRFPTLDQIFTGEEEVEDPEDPEEIITVPKPNLDLEAETSVNYTVGVSWDFDDMLGIEFSSFYHDISDWITRESALNPFDQYINYENVEMLGAEIGAVWTPIEDLVIKAAYMINDAENKSSGRVTEKVVEVPENELDLMVQYVVPNLKTKFNLTLMYMGRSYSEVPTLEYPDDPVVENDSYTILNARITQPIMDRFEAYLAFSNLFDEEYEPNTGFPAQGRQIWLGVTYKY